MINKRFIALGLMSLASACFTAPLLFAEEADKAGNANASKTKDTSAHASADAESKLIAKLQGFNSLTGRFEQTLTAKSGAKIQTTYGTFSLKRPGLYRWLSDEPFPQEVVGNGETIWVYDPDLEQVTVTPQAQMGFNPATILSGDLSALKGQYIVSMDSESLNPKNVKGESYTLVPAARGNAMFKKLTLTFADGSIEDVQFVDQLGQLSRIQFSKLQANSAMDDAQFEFVVPEGADVLMNE